MIKMGQITKKYAGGFKYIGTSVERNRLDLENEQPDWTICY